MGLRQRLADLFWPPELGGEGEGEGEGRYEATTDGEAAPVPPTAPPGPGLGARLKRVGISEERRQATSHRLPPVPAGHQPGGRGRTGPSLKQRLQQVGVPDLDAKELARQQRILEASREAESRSHRVTAYKRVAGACPVPIHPQAVPLPGGLRLRDDEFLVASSSRPSRNRDLTLTTQRLVYSRGRDAGAQLVVYLADICDVVFHADDTITVGTPSGRWEKVPVAGNSVAASRDRLLALVHHARAQRPALAGGRDDPADPRDRGPMAGTGYEPRRAAATASPRRRRDGQVEVSGRPATRATPPAEPRPAPDDAALAMPTGGEAEAQPGGEER
jgi:hypothetical protein